MGQKYNFNHTTSISKSKSKYEVKMINKKKIEINAS